MLVLVQWFGHHLGHHDPPRDVCGVLSTLYQEQHAPQTFTFSSDAQMILTFSDSGYLEGLAFQCRYSYICPKYIQTRSDRYVAELYENCMRSSPRMNDTEMYRKTGFSTVRWCVHFLVQVHAAQPFPGRSGFLISRGFHHPRPFSTESKVFRFGGSNRLWPLWEYLADQMCRAVLYQTLLL